MPRRRFDVHLSNGVVVLTLWGILQFEETSHALAAAADTALRAGSRHVLFDLRAADLSNYYSYAVRHAEAAPGLGVDLAAFKLAFLGEPRAADVLSFMEMICRNRGWEARHFTALEPALKWMGVAKLREVGLKNAR